MEDDFVLLTEVSQ